MISLLLPIIYMAFISLGLPDSLLGSAWPVIHTELNISVSYAGILTMIISGGTIVSSLFADRLICRLGTGLVTALSVALTAAALFGFSLCSSFIGLCFIAVPYGLGAGAVDAALNNYVALHYSSRHMSWLHAFWGIGVTISPNIMGFCLTKQLGWHAGYGTVAVLQTILTAILFISLPLWKKASEHSGDNTDKAKGDPKPLGLKRAFRIKGVPYVMLAFLAYCALESTAGLWASSYLTAVRGVSAEAAASFTAFYYFGETGGRFITGFVADKIGDRNMIRIGIAVIVFGVILILLPLGTSVTALVGLVVLGLGSAPVYPCIIHSTPQNFGKENSQAMIGIQMASAYVGSTFMPPLFGILGENIGMSLYPFYLGLFAVLLILGSERLNRAVSG